MNKTYVTDIEHYLNDSGDVAPEMPAAARELASFLTLLIDEVTQVMPARDHDTRIRCRIEACTGSIRAKLASQQDPIKWYCPACGHHGIISNWQHTKWDRTASKVT